jgi:tetratricopeptide (TPR) repeat protein
MLEDPLEPQTTTSLAETPPADPKQADVVRSLVPRWLAAAPAPMGRQPLVPAIAPLPCAAVFADISGFSALMRMFAERGGGGIETLIQIVGDFLGQLLDTVAAWGGDVENLYGDGILAFWPVAATGETATAQAAGCAAELIQRFNNFAAAPGVTLRLRAAVVAGDCFAMQLGGVSDHWLFLLAGECLGAFGPLLDEARSGEVALGPGMRMLLPSASRFMPASRLAQALRRIAVRPLHLPATPRIDSSTARMFLSRPLRHRTSDSSGWVAEFRAVTVLCTGFTGLRCDAPEHLAHLQATVARVQTIVQAHDGAVVRASMSEKGPMILAAFGVPDCAHDDDPSRAVLAATQIVQDGATFGARCTVASGTGFCGVIGNGVRRAFSPAGAAVNQAAKLLTLPGLPAVVCDEATARGGDYRILTQPIDAAELPTGSSPLFAAFLSQGGLGPAAVIGRNREFGALLCHVEALAGPAGRGGIVTIEGEAGIGKNRLAQYLLHRVAGRLPALRCAADPMTGATPLAALAPLFAALFAPEVAAGREAVAAAVADILRYRAIEPAHAALAAPVLPLVPERRPPTLPPADMARAERDVLLALLDARLRDRPALLLIEETHWLDSASWLLIDRAARALPRLLFVLTARPATDPEWRGFEAVLDAPPTERLILQPLNEAEMAEVLQDALDCARIEPRVLAAIGQRARGSPLFAVQLALGLRDRGALVQAHGTCMLREDGGENALQSLPDTLQRTIIARFDRLSEALQVTLKIASIFGGPFSTEALRAMAAVPDPSHARSVIAGLIRAGLLRQVPLSNGDPHGGYDFSQPIAREAIYGVLPFAQRRRLHEEVAHYLEHTSKVTPAPDALLGHHWARADRPAEAIVYWERAGGTALDGGAYREAARAYAEAVQAAERLDAAGSPPPHIAVLRQHLGESLLHSGELLKSRVELQRALAHLGRPMGRNRARDVLALSRYTAQLAWHEMRGRPPVIGGAGSASERHGQLTRIYENLGQVFAHTSDVVGMATCVVAAVHAAQRSGNDAAYSRATGLLALVCLLMGWSGAADRYYAHACRTRPGIDRPHDRLMTSEYLAIYLLAAARLEEAEAELRHMIALAAESGNQRRGLDATSLLTLCLMETGRPLECTPLHAALAADADQYGDPQLRCWVALEQAEIALAAAPDSTAERHLGMAERLLPRLGVHEAVWTFGLLAALHAAQGRTKEALVCARQVTTQATGRKLAIYAQHGMFGAATVLLGALRQSSGFERRELVGETRRAMRQLADFALHMPLARPRGLLMLGQHAVLQGQQRRADRLATRAIAEATRQGRPYHQSIAFPWSPAVSGNALSTDPTRQ